MRHLWFIASLSACLFALIGGPFAARVFAQTLPTADELQAKIDAATGTRPASMFESITFTQGGVSGARTIVRSGDDVRETRTFGTMQTASGTFKAQAWYQNENGQTVLEQPDPPDSTETSEKVTVSRVAVPFDAYVIARLNDSGYGTKDYVDPVSNRIVRHDAIGARRTWVTTYDDFHTVDGYTTAWHWISRNGYAEDETEERITAFSVRPVEPTELAIAPPRRALVEFPSGEASVALPVRLIDGRFVVRVSIGGHDLDFELDTGTAGIAIDHGLARKLGLSEIARFSEEEDSGHFRGSYVRVPKLDVGALRLRDVVTSTLPGKPDEVYGADIVGLLGFDFIAESLLQLDYERGTVDAMRADLSVASLPRGSILLNVRFVDEVPLMPVAINGFTGTNFLVDTGDTAGLIVFDRFTHRFPHALVQARGRVVPYALQRPPIEIVSYGVNRTPARPYIVGKVSIGTAEFINDTAFLEVPRKAYDGSYDGIIGVDKLRYFTVWLDYVNARILLTPNAAGRAAMK